MDARRALRRAAGGVLIAVALVALLEAGARVLRPARRSAEIAEEGRDLLAPSATLGWRIRPGFSGVAFDAQRSYDAEGVLAEDAETAAATRRILFLGDSRTYGNGVRAAETYPEVLRTLLPNTQIRNAGVPGYSSYQGLVALQELAPRLRPAVVVFAFGFNDRRYVASPVAPDGPDAFRALARRAALARL
jgi:hypothetical protein